MQTLSNVDIATALAKMSPDDRAYVDRLADDLRPARRRRRRRTAVKKAARAARASKPSAETPKAKKTKKTKKAPRRLIGSESDE